MKKAPRRFGGSFLAAEEVVADGMELILTDGKVLNELANTD